MPRCFKCMHNFASIKALIIHIRISHELPNNILCCVEIGCTRVFDKLDTFTRHLRKKHYSKPAEAVSCNAQNHTNTNISGDNTDQSEDNIGMNKPPTVNPSADVINDDNFHIIQKRQSDLEEILWSKVVEFISTFYSNRKIPRSVIQTIIEQVQGLMVEPLSIIKDVVFDQLRILGESHGNISCLENMFNTIENPFKSMSTEYLRLKYFTDVGYYIHPEDVIVGQRLTARTSNNPTTVETLNEVMKFIPLRKTLKFFFEMPNVFYLTMKYLDELSGGDDLLQNFVQGELWKKKSQKYQNKIALPVFIYFDEFEVNNPLGSRAGLKKLGAVYCSIPCLPPKFQSKIESIFLVQLFIAEHRVKYGNLPIFKKLIDELAFLQDEGIMISTPDGEKRLFFVLSLLIGDNLGLHSILGLVESFSANHPCRFCYITKNEISTSFVEDPTKLRTRNAYQEDVSAINVYETGVKENCVWHGLEDFHITENYAVDAMHDWLEGICKFDMKLILIYLISIEKLFSLETLNYRMVTFNYGFIDKRNKPPFIKNLNNIKMSATEMLCFVRYLSLLVGDLVPQENEYWVLYLKLREILELIMAPMLQKECDGLLSTLISEHNQLYSSLSNGNLKPKNHHATHYPKILKMSGPLVHLWSMRFEAYHQQCKKSASATTSRVNIIHTIASRESMKFCEQLLANKGFADSVIVGPSITKFRNSKESLPPEFMTHTYTRWVELNGIRYRLNLAVMIDAMDPTPGVIQQILINHQGKVCFGLLKYETVSFNEHLHAYEVEKTVEFIYLTAEKLLFPIPFSLVSAADAKLYYIRRYAL